MSVRSGPPRENGGPESSAVTTPASITDSTAGPASDLVRPLLWMRAVRDATRKPTTAQLAVLWALALRMNENGTGFAYIKQLAGDAGVHEHTARRAISWARRAGWLLRTRRGHRLNDDTAIASEYRLRQPCAAARLATDPTVYVSTIGTAPNGAEAPTQPRTGARIQRSVTQSPMSLSSAERLLVEHGANHDEAREMVASLERANVDQPLPYLRAVERNGDLASLIARQRQSRANAGGCAVIPARRYGEMLAAADVDTDEAAGIIAREYSADPDARTAALAAFNAAATL